MTQKRETFLTGLESENSIQTLREFMGYHNDKANDFKFEDFLQTFPNKDLNRLWKSLKEINQNAFFASKFDQKQISEYQLSLFNEDDTTVIQSTFLLAKATFSVSPLCPENLISTLCLYHERFFCFPAVIQDNIALTIEKLWNTEYAKKETCIPAIITYLLLKALQEDKTQKYIKRLYALKNGFVFLDIDAPQSDTLRALLLKAIFSPPFLISKEGRSLCSIFFLLSPKFPRELYGSILANIIHSPLSLARFYGEILFQAWSEADMIQRKVLETDILQNVLARAVHASTPTLFRPLSEILNAFNRNKLDSNVESMLFDIYDPIIWRALNAANASVRKNAFIILINVFPLQNGGEHKEDTNIIQKQFDILFKFLTDNTIAVRVAAIEGVCKILYLYWELVPISVSKTILKYILSQSIYDVASNSIRIAVIQGIVYLLDNPLSFSEVKSYLPRLCLFICDKNERVRFETVKLLLKVSQIRSLSLFSLIPVDILLSQIYIDRSVSRLLSLYTQLILPIFWPRNEPGRVQILYILNFMYLNKDTAGIILREACKTVGPAGVSKLVVLLLRSLILCIHEKELVFPPLQNQESSESKQSTKKRSISQLDEQKDNTEDQSGAANGISRNEFPANELWFQGNILEIIGLLMKEMMRLFTVAKDQEVKDPDNRGNDENDEDIDSEDELITLKTKEFTKNKKSRGYKNTTKYTENSIEGDIEKTRSYLLQEFNNDSLMTLYTQFHNTDSLQYIYDIISFFSPTQLQQQCETFYTSILSVSITNNWNFDSISAYIYTIFSWNLQNDFIQSILKVTEEYFKNPSLCIHKYEDEEEKEKEKEEKKKEKKKSKGKKGKGKKNAVIEEHPVIDQTTDSHGSDEEIDIYLAVSILEVVIRLYIQCDISLDSTVTTLIHRTFTPLLPILNTLFQDIIVNKQFDWQIIEVYSRLFILYCKLEIYEIASKRDKQSDSFEYMSTSLALTDLTSTIQSLCDNQDNITNYSLRFLYTLSSIQLSLLYTSISIYQYDEQVVHNTFIYMTSLSTCPQLYQTPAGEPADSPEYSFFITHNLPLFNKLIYLLYNTLKSLPIVTIDSYLSYIYVILSSYPAVFLHVLSTIRSIIRIECIQNKNDALCLYLLSQIETEVNNKKEELSVLNINNDLSTFSFSTLSAEFFLICSSSIPLFQYSYHFFLNKMNSLSVSPSSYHQYKAYLYILYILYKANNRRITIKQVPQLVKELDEFEIKFHSQVMSNQELNDDKNSKELYLETYKALVILIGFFKETKQKDKIDTPSEKKSEEHEE
ncbi:hypothetical protein WA158_001650 [Blastocystis sp. Blastoise]